MTIKPAALDSDTRFSSLIQWLQRFVEPYRLDLANLTPASADASFRRYYRVPGTIPGKASAPLADHNPKLPHNGQPDVDSSAVDSLIVMDAAPPEKCREFEQVALLMAQAGLIVPKVLERDLDLGMMLLTDLGATTYLDALSRQVDACADPLPGTPEARALMRAALDALIRWQLATRPGVLPRFDASFMQREMALMPEWFMKVHLGNAATPQQTTVLDTTFKILIDSAQAQPQVFMHRDFMARNLMVMQPGVGVEIEIGSGPGVLDFQDAVEGPITYDVASLMRDAFISFDEAFQLDCIAFYWENAKRAGLPVDPDFGEFYRQIEWMGLQRHLKIIGLFPRIHYRDGKPRYLSDLPRFLGYAQAVARRYRPLAPLARLLDELEGQAPSVAYSF
jgi:aminoglycoside/choline kinase family phosphotransferase